MDLALFAPLGLAMAEIPMVAAIVNPTVNQFKGTFLLTGRATLLLAYGLSFLLMFLVTSVLDQNLLGMGWPTMLAKTLIAGWLAATYAGQITEVQAVTDVRTAQAAQTVPVESPIILP